MLSKQTDVATRFIELALKHECWSEIKGLPASEIQILFDTVSAAGFNPKKVMPGKLVGNYLDQDGSRTGETYPINDFCPFKVLREDGDDYLATGWLDRALRHALYVSERQKENREEAIKEVAKTIEQSIPLEMIQLTPEGDLLREYPPDVNTFSGFFVKHTRDTDKLNSCVGVHEFCNGWMDRGRATRTHDAIVCRSCHLRVLFPRGVKTYGDLRTVASQWAQVSA
jgi:hypothetical protein